MEPQIPGSAIERRVAIAVATAGIAVFGVLLLLVPPFFISFDEAKYIGIGYNLLDGLGPRTPFGDYFLPHAPVWSAVVVIPDAWFGIDPLDTGHVLNGISGLILLAITAALGWRIRPAVGGIAAVGHAGRDISPRPDPDRASRRPGCGAGARLPSRSRSLLSAGAERAGASPPGALFALAFLVKEIALPLAPVAFIAAILWGTPWRRIAGVAGWTLITAAIGLSWWFVLVADLSGVVYRLGTPAWTLVPIGAGVAIVAVLLIIAGRGDTRAGADTPVGVDTADRPDTVVGPRIGAAGSSSPPA